MPKSEWRTKLKNEKFKKIKNCRKRADFYYTIRRVAVKHFNDLKLIIDKVPEKQLDAIMLNPDVEQSVQAISYAFYLAHKRKKEKELEPRKTIRKIKKEMIFDLAKDKKSE